MRALRRKLIAELIALRWQALAVCLVLASGVATFVMSLTTLDSLQRTRDDYFRESRFAHVFSGLRRAPRALEARLAEVAGVEAVETRIVAVATLDLEGLAEPATGCFISLPESEEPAVNRLHLRTGRLPDPARRGEALVGEAFAEAHRLQPGDRLRAVLNGRLETLTVAGVALSPEYVYSVRGGELLPDDRHFGVIWLGRRDLEAAFDLDGAFNDVVALLAPGGDERRVIEAFDRLLAEYGGAGAYGRSEQSSYRFLENELIELRGMAMLPPAIFLSVSAFLLQVVLARLVATQREQIATLRAFGYDRGEIQRHFRGMALILIVVGVAAGTAAGAWLGRDLTRLYSRFFRFPEFQYRVAAPVVFGALGLSLVSGLGAVRRTVRRAAEEPPAAAMQPEPPPRYRPSWAERTGWGRRLSPAARMVLRHLERRPWRAALSSLGIALAVAILVLGNFAEDAIDFVMTFQFEHAHRQDLTVVFTEPSSARAVHDLRHLPGVLEVEPFRSAPVRIRHRSYSRRIGLTGVVADARLFRVLDADRRPVTLPPEGLVLSERLAAALDCRPGDMVRLELLDGERPVRDVPVASVVRDFIDLNAYMDLAALRRMLGEQSTSSGAFAAVDPARLDELYVELKRRPRVASVGIRRAMLDSYRRTLAENILRMRAVNLAFAAIVAFGVVYNAARVALSERSRELATLRVLGFTRYETSFILLAELGLLVLLAIPVGMAIGYGFSALLVWSLATEVHRFPLVVSAGTLTFSVAVTVVAAVFSALVVRRRIDRLDLVSVLKARD